MKLSALSPRTLIITSLVAGMSIGAMGVTAAVAARQPAMEDALAFLNRADSSLARASANKGGHRAEARRLIAAAIQQVRLGIRYANVN